MCLLLLLLFFFFFHFFFLQNAFFPYLPFNYSETLETIKKKEIFHIVGCQYAWSSKARLKLIQHSVTVFGSVITLR